MKTNNNNINNTNNNHQVQINIGSINNNNYTLGKNSITENMKKTMKDINDDYEKHLEVLNKEEEEIKKLLELMNVKIDLPNIVNKNSFNNEKQQNISILSIESNPNSRKVSENNKNEEEKKENDKKNEEKKENDKKNEENNKEEIKKENDNNSKVNNNDKK